MAGWEVAEGAWRIAFIPLVMILVMGLAWHALKLSQGVVRVPPVLGRHPNKEDADALRKTITRLEGLRSEYRHGLLWHWVQLGLFGILLPAVLFVEVCLYATSLIENSPFLLADGFSWPRIDPTDQQVLLYVWDQISSALTLGLFEIWQWKPWSTIIVHDPQIPVVFFVVFFFRGIIEFFSGAWIFAGFLALWNARVAKTTIEKRIDQHQLELRAAVQAQASKQAITAEPRLAVAA